MKLRQLECLRAIITTGSMTAAAEMLRVAQPSVSSMIANLEYELGFKLFFRQQGRLSVTPEARHILPDILRTLDCVEFTRQNARQIKERKLGDLTIAAFPDIAVEFLPRIISGFMTGTRRIAIKLQARRSEMMSGLLPTQQFDMAIVTQIADTQALDVEEFTLRCVCALPEGHRLAERDVIRPGDLAGEAMVSLLAEHATVGQLSAAFAADRIAGWHPAIETQTFESASAFIRNGAGIGLLDPLTADRYSGKGVIVRPFEPAILQRIFILIPQERPRSRLLEAFHQHLRAALAPFTMPDTT